MADIKVILANYKSVVGNVSSGAKTASVTTPQTIAKTSQPSIPTNFAGSPIDVIVTNAGETSIPEAGIGRFAGDSFTISERFSNQIGKALIEIETISDAFSRTVLFNRTFTEVENTIEQVVFNTAKGIAETFTRYETVYNSLQKSILESFTRIDTAYLDFTKYVSDVFGNYELVTFQSTKGIVEIQIASDTFDRVFTVFRSFDDIVDATDDVLGEANVDDDQVANVSKASIDWISQVDLSLLHTTKAFNETELFSDLSFFNVLKNHNDSQITVEEIYFNSLKELADTATESDVVSFDYSKQYADYTYNSDIYEASFLKILAHNTTNIDVNSKESYTVYNDIGDVSDVVSQNFSKYLEHSFTKADTTYWLINKDLSETQLTSAVLSFNLDYNLLDVAVASDSVAVNFSTFAFDSFTKQDLAIYLVGKVSADSTTNSELYYFDKTKALEDLVDATDDVFGEANVDDDQIAAFTKTLNDTSTTLEGFSRTFTAYRSYNDTFVNTDVTYLQPGLSKLETTLTTDSQIYRADTVYGDVIANSDVNGKYMQVIHSDVEYALDNIQTVVTSFRSFDEVESLLDYISKDYLKQVLESTVTSELFVKNINKGLTDIVTTSESFTPVNGRAFSEPQDISDSGTANNQNYFSTDYVEPGYVGTNTYF